MSPGGFIGGTATLAEHLLDLLLDRIRSEETEGHEPLS